MVDMDDNKLLHFTLIPLLLELRVTEKLEKVGFILSSVVELDTLHLLGMPMLIKTPNSKNYISFLSN